MSLKKIWKIKLVVIINFTIFIIDIILLLFIISLLLFIILYIIHYTLCIVHYILLFIIIHFLLYIILLLYLLTGQQWTIVTFLKVVLTFLLLQRFYNDVVPCAQCLCNFVLFVCVWLSLFHILCDCPILHFSSSFYP